MTALARCTCSRCSTRSLMGPAVVTTIGVLFLLSELRGGYYHIGRTFPVLFIVIGAILLASALAPMEGHVETFSHPAPPPATPPSVPSGYNNPYAGQGQ